MMPSSHIGQEDIAELTNFAYNKQPLQLRVGMYC